ncbi:hypothetical protein CFK37_04615 [Virgibacillus phasianinus]|uniref:DUF1648 domain-containing protein n=1 Tax=Virgibacillus phasianinus TaxID=2017483 RepID=A0A220U0K0_9BACI|nr:DUF5808 domain-containing protein [Virgibacillus phasianinus]ASK61505.1 hypothetical protein CFK37_04615 [Virgibacillus phasianinus]
MNVTMVILLLVIMIPVFISLMFIPYWTRKTESFGVSIPEEIYHSPKLKSMRNRYVVLTGIVSALVAIVFLVTGSYFEDEETMSILFSIIVGLFMIGSFFIYLKFHREMKALKKKENWSEKKSQLVVVDTKFRDQKLTYSNLWFIISFIIAFASMFITFRFYDRIPERIPMQYDFEGNITNWSEKSYRALMVMPIMQVYLTLLFIFINTMIGKAKQQVNAGSPEESMRRNVIFRRRWSGYIIITGIALTLMFLLTQLSFIFKINQQLLVTAPLVLGIGVTVGAIILSITTGQGGSRVKISSSMNGQVIDRDDDRYWKLGMFYFNKNDPSIFLEKRFGVGWTNNWAHPISWIIILVIIAGAVGIPILLGE